MMSRMAVRSTDWIVNCRAEYVLTDLGVISDWLWDDAEHGLRTDSSGWLVGDQAVSLCSWSCGDGWLSD